MKIKIFSISIFTIFILLFIGLLIFRHKRLYENKVIDKSKLVYVEKTDKGFQLIRNGNPFYIKGAAGDSYFKELADVGGNTIRLYDTINLENNLDTAAKYGLAVIVDIPIPAFSYSNQLNEEDFTIIKHRIKNLVNNYKNHNALLMWNLGNETNYPKIRWKDFLRKDIIKKRYVRNFNELIDIIHEEDKNHLVSTSTWNVTFEHIASLKLFSSGIDLIAFNTFGDVKNLLERIKNWSYIFGNSPYFISEFSSDGWWFLESRHTAWMSPIEQTTVKKVEQIVSRFNLIKTEEQCLGSLLFYWGYKYECTDTWFSLFKDEYKSEILLSLEVLWGNTNRQLEFTGLDYMLVDGKGSRDNLIFTSDKIVKSELKFNKHLIDSLTVIWKIYPDNWFHGWNEEKYNKKILDPPTQIDCFLSTEKDKVTFITPRIEGPYRIFAYVYYNGGYFASTNTPFYISNPK